jgi:hypothetical protein
MGLPGQDFHTHIVCIYIYTHYKDRIFWWYSKLGNNSHEYGLKTHFFHCQISRISNFQPHEISQQCHSKARHTVRLISGREFGPKAAKQVVSSAMTQQNRDVRNNTLDLLNRNRQE